MVFQIPLSEKDKKQRGDASDVCALLHLPTEFFHSARAAIPAPLRSRSLRLTQGLRLSSPASWASLHSTGAHSKMLCTQVGSEDNVQSVTLHDTKYGQ